MLHANFWLALWARRRVEAEKAWAHKELPPSVLLEMAADDQHDYDDTRSPQSLLDFVTSRE